MIEPYPLVFEPIAKAKVWGGRRLGRYGKPLPTGACEGLGETWEIADLGSTSVSGGGGGEARSIVANGPLKGRGLHEVMGLWGSRLMGNVRPADTGGFPLLVKFLDAREHLSVQVHPSPAYAAAHPQAHLKTESWYIVEAESTHGEPPVIYKGLRPGTTRAALERAIWEGRVRDVLLAAPAIPGECHTLPSGTVHALGAGVLVAEVQTPSDTTFRAYDWTREYNRPRRDLHIAECLECADLGPPPPATRLEPGKARGVLDDTPFYRLFEFNGASVLLANRAAPAALIVVKGSGALDGGGQRLTLTAGMTVLVPASVGVRWAGPTVRVLVVEPAAPQR